MSLNIDKLREDWEKLQRPSSSQKKVRWYYPERGVTRIRILPPLKPDDVFYRFIGRHSVPAPNEKGSTNYICRRITYGDKCPICDMIDFITTNYRNDKEAKEVASALVPYYLIYMNALILGHKPTIHSQLMPVTSLEDPSLPVVLVVRRKVHADILNLILGEYGDITDPQTGRWIDIIRIDTPAVTYTVQPAPSPSPLENFDYIRQHMYDLDEIVRERDVVYDELQEKFMLDIYQTVATHRISSLLYSKFYGDEFEALEPAAQSQPSLPTVEPTPIYSQPTPQPMPQQVVPPAYQTPPQPQIPQQPVVQPTQPAPSMPTVSPTAPTQRVSIPTPPPTPPTPTPTMPQTTESQQEKVTLSPDTIAKIEELRKKFQKGS
ncbi:MAG: hypothetical protein ABIM32_03650 [candidate division WOR-3 bacterium]